jgi:alpha-glucosidase
MPVTLDSLPLFVRGGAFIFRQPVVQYTAQMRGNALHVLMTAALQSDSTFYEDDGESLDFHQGAFWKRRFTQTQDDVSTTIVVTPPEGSYRPAKRDLVFEMWADCKPKSVSLQFGNGNEKGEPLPHLDSAALVTAARGWTYDDGFLRVKDTDQFDQERLVIQR